MKEVDSNHIDWGYDSIRKDKLIVFEGVTTKEIVTKDNDLKT